MATFDVKEFLESEREQVEEFEKGWLEQNLNEQIQSLTNEEINLCLNCLYCLTVVFVQFFITIGLYLHWKSLNYNTMLILEEMKQISKAKNYSFLIIIQYFETGWME